ncbi:hypothetical protein FHX74_003495 [Friedmanniella endophytica]|uniref:Heme peroxidase n=1 Tax=Microlunatus kandeliicorticis TaxID=1759536 RepID=A0A7W3P7B6_9ACTN|nr:hypothetical protein [Microlunatus kandeliicorticis]MBA8795854.1 hypothetical protein [Microlunatus kandeliicorticis]
MTSDPSDVTALVSYCEQHLGDPHVWEAPPGYPDSLALCIIDSVYSTGSHYASVVKVVDRYREKRGSADGARGLLESIDAVGGPQAWAREVAGNVKPANTRPGAPLKAEVVQQAAQLMTGLAIDTVQDLVAVVRPSPTDNPVHTGWKRLPSQSSGVTYNYLLILAGLPSVKPDRMVLRFLGDTLGRSITRDDAVALVTATADHLGVSARVLDHVVWRAASGRELVD